MSNDVSATDLSAATDLPAEATPSVFDSLENANDSSSLPIEVTETVDDDCRRVPVEFVVIDSSVEAADSTVELAAETEEEAVADSTSDTNSHEIIATVEVVEEDASGEVSVESEAVETEAVETEAVESESTESESTESEATESEAVESKTVDVPVSNPFEELGLSRDVISAIKKAGYESPSPIQAETVPHILQGRDMMGQAETGSGKTAAFAWPILTNLDPKQRKPQVLVLAPTRELAIQVTRAFEKYASGINGFRAVTIYGGQSYETQIRALQRGVQIVVGTPGRVMDHLRRGTLVLDSVKTFILDEADEMLRMGFIDDVEWILEQVPAKRQILTFSATLPPPIQRIAQKYLKDPAHVVIKSDTATANSIEQTCVFLNPREKMARLVRLLETEETEGVLVFVKTRNTTMVVAEHLIQKGIIASALNGDIAQNQRERTINQLKSGRINVVVATDVAARGLDVERISHVINYDFPHDTEAYVHRIGRTGRAGRKGCAVLFVEPKEKGKLSRLQRATNQRIETFKDRSIDEINAVRVANFKQRIVDATSDKQVKYFTNLVEELQSEKELTPTQIASALAIMAQGESPLLLKEFKSPQSNWKKGREKNQGRDRGPMKTFRVEVGRSHGVGPGNIVGAITNEADLNNSMIGRINIFNDFSTIDLPADIPQDLIDHLRGVQVSGQRLEIAADDRKYANREPRGRSGGRYEKKGYSKKSFGKKPWEKKSGDGKSFGKKSWEKKPFSDRASQPNRDVGSEAKKRVEKQSGDKKFAKPYSEKPSGEKGRFNEKSSHGSGAPSGRKKHGYSKLDKVEFNSEGYSKTKNKKSAPKTKTALRTQAKRKPGAKLSSPIKKYVKIRSAK
ncbi:MAG: DEAD/DEAH box helicase [Mariniblastus sp.]|nr:DEAD/DEAH box helicase [Mariniblastus sp.]